MNFSSKNPLHPAPGTPTVNGYSPALLTHNPNLNPGNGTGATNPFRLSPAQAGTNDQDHNYTPEQEAYDGGLMDLFPEFTGTAGPPPGAPPISLTKGLTMGYYDGNTVTAYWNYAQHFSMSDNSFDTNFGPSTPGAINVISGQTLGDAFEFEQDKSGIGGSRSQSGIGLKVVHMTWFYIESQPDGVFRW